MEYKVYEDEKDYEVWWQHVSVVRIDSNFLSHSSGIVLWAWRRGVPFVWSKWPKPDQGPVLSSVYAVQELIWMSK